MPRVSIPFIAGQWSLRPGPEQRPAVAGLVSIPFIAGQWSLPIKLAATWDGSPKSQSPSLRGSGRFRPPRRSSPAPRSRLNPLHCGAVVASAGGVTPRRRCVGLNPLHCGAVVASPRTGRGRPRPRVSIPFIAGQWSLPSMHATARTLNGGVSIPFIAGQWSLPEIPALMWECL